MKSLILYSLLFCIYTNETNSQIKPDSKIFIEKLKNSEKEDFLNFLNQYDYYLKTHPFDKDVWIDKCDFLLNAQYNSSEDYNPNQDLYDSTLKDMYNRFKNEPSVILYQIENLSLIHI